MENYNLKDTKFFINIFRRGFKRLINFIRHIIIKVNTIFNIFLSKLLYKRHLYLPYVNNFYFITIIFITIKSWSLNSKLFLNIKRLCI